ncbi:MAG: DEAD/DEAH box helicase family protein [Deferrisomatales bacterium]|nr:DEAD/DEAH box helicase family protein [Deferrisomatales bacterium]
MNRHVNAISGRLSLRKPQRDSLEILARITEIAPPRKDADLAAALQVIRSEYPNVQDFERDFPSICFALATGVGKTRLMGAFVAYLHLAKGIRHFFVLAPNLTIYNKLIADFTPNTPKYVLRGIAEFATTPPVIITGDNYEAGHGVRDEAARQLRLFGADDAVHINIFNISKINSEVRGGKAPRIKRLSEYIGESYFDYLAGLDDLVLMMDESHRYRAAAGMRAINELKPILGLELTATPHVEASGGKTIPFRNVIYDYPLAHALRDGFVKQPAVATRENFDPGQHSQEGLETIKIEDGVRVHEAVKVELDVFGRQNHLPVVKPFMLIVARDISHAGELVARIESKDFFEGRYAGKVIQVDSSKTGADEDEMVQRLLAVENPNEPTEIVVHVNMLKEGWDVTNLYTIVPLRAANSRTLVEQSIGRGLRLPYGRRVGVSAVDTLTIVAHDRFQEIVDEANRPDSAIRLERIYIGKDIAEEAQQAVTVEPTLTQPIPRPGGDPPRERTEPEKQVAKTTMDVIRTFERLPTSRDLTRQEIQQQIVAEVKSRTAPVQPELYEAEGAPDVEAIVAETVETYVARTIDIPRVLAVPTGEVSSGFRDFDLERLAEINLPPVSRDILIQTLDTGERSKLAAVEGGEEERLEDYLVRVLIDFDDVCYDEHADLLYKLAGQIVARLQSYLADEAQVRNVLLYHQRRLANLIHAQMQQHRWESATAYEAQVTKGFKTFSPTVYKAPAGEQPRDYRTPVDDRQNIRRMLFTGFAKCIYPIQKFDSDPERRFSAILEADPQVEKWFKPARGDFHIYYQSDTPYEPDFVVETKTAKLICEPKRADQVGDPVVQEKARGAVQWCGHASAHEAAHGGKPWSYLLIPHDAIRDNMTIEGMVGMFRQS